MHGPDGFEERTAYYDELARQHEDDADLELERGDELRDTLTPVCS